MTGDASASAEGAATEIFPTQPGEWWDSSAWDVTPYLTATCDAGFVTCCRGFEGECDADGNPTSDTTCMDVCSNGAGGYDCCRNDSGTGDVNACTGFTGKVCRDGSCSLGDKACNLANVGEIINGCQGKMSCSRVGWIRYTSDNPNEANPVPRIHNSCRSSDHACASMATDQSHGAGYTAKPGNEVGNIINSCNGNSDPDATDHLDPSYGTFQCALMGERWGTVGDVVNSCTGNQACAMVSREGTEAYPSTVGNILGSCHGYLPCSNLVRNGAVVGDIVDSCNSSNACQQLYYKNGFKDHPGTMGDIVRSGIGNHAMISLGFDGGIIGDMYDSCNGSFACQHLGRWQPNGFDSSVGNVIGSCNADYACDQLANGGHFGDVLGSCLEASSCRYLAQQNDSTNWEKSLTCCADESEATTGTCSASSPADTTLCSIGDASTLASYCGSDSCPAGAARPASSSTGTDTGTLCLFAFLAILI